MLCVDYSSLYLVIVHVNIFINSPSLSSSFSLSSPPPPSLALSLHTDQSSTDNLAAIIGGVVGGLIVLGFTVAMIIIVIFLMIQCSSRKGINVFFESVHSYDIIPNCMCMLIIFTALLNV